MGSDATVHASLDSLIKTFCRICWVSNLTEKNGRPSWTLEAWSRPAFDTLCIVYCIRCHTAASFSGSSAALMWWETSDQHIRRHDEAVWGGGGGRVDGVVGTRRTLHAKPQVRHSGSNQWEEWAGRMNGEREL